MLRQICRRGRLEAILQQTADDDIPALTTDLRKLLRSHSAYEKYGPARPLLSGSKTAKMLAEGTAMSHVHYRLLLDHLNRGRAIWRHYTAPPNSPGSKTLPHFARHRSEISHDGRTYSCRTAHEGNSCISFFAAQNVARYSGFITAIWSLPLDGVERTFLLVQLHDMLSFDDNAKSPFSTRPRLLCRLAPAAPAGRQEVVELHQVISHLAMWKRPRSTYSIDTDTIVLCGALDRGRKG